MLTLEDLTILDFPFLQDWRSCFPHEGVETDPVAGWGLNAFMEVKGRQWITALDMRCVYVRILSGFRGSAEQAPLIEAGRGAVNSQHLTGNAIDFEVMMESDRALRRQKIVFAGLVWTYWGYTWGGLFRRDDSNHIDGRLDLFSMPNVKTRISHVVESIKAGDWTWTIT